MQLPLLWVPQENLSWYSALNIYHKVTIAIKCMPINWRFFVPNFIDIEPGLLELFENVTGVWFFLRHSVVQNYHLMCRLCRVMGVNSCTFGHSNMAR